jgi:uncharacterized protein RhaS with RHS repeats
LLGGLNLYQYAPNPLLWIDPWGLVNGNCGGRNDKLSSPNHVPKSIREEYENIITGKGTPRTIDPRTGSQTIHEGRQASKWKGAKEWDVPGTNNRILEKTMPNGQKIYGYVVNHDYRVVKTFPAPWYPDGGKPAW